ncbi:hypothetical protein GF314_12445 [bacterium]|nr:hypothetical protein [bacterium]
MRTILVLGLAIALAGGAPSQERAAVWATDYNTAAHVTGIDLQAPWSAGPLPGEPAYHDAVLRWHDGRVWVVNRAGADNVQVLDPAQGFDTVAQYSLGLGRNIQDIGFAPDGTAYVSCYDTAELLHIDPEDGTILDVISTAAFADQDGLPETGWLRVHDGRVFVSCQRLDRDQWYAPVGDSYLLVLDVDTGSWIDADPGQPGTQGILLAASDPYTPIAAAGDRLYVGCTGYYGVQDGGIDVIDPAALVSLGLEITESELGGDLVDLALTGETRHVVVADPGWVTHVQRYAPGQAPVTLLSGTAYDHADIAWDGDFQLLVADRRTSSPGVRVLDTVSGAELTTGPVSVGLPPAMIAIAAGEAPVGVHDAPGAALAMSAPWPNPANPATSIRFGGPPGVTATVRVLDLRGRLVREVRVATDGDGRGAWVFDGRDQLGRAAASGVYRCVVETAGGYAARSFTIVR